MSNIGDLFGEYATPFKKRVMKEISDKIEATRKKQKMTHITKNCSYCDSDQAWYSSDYGTTWQCHAHKRD